MKKNVLQHLFASVAALFIILLALPQTAQAQQNSVTIDGVKKTVLSSWYYEGYDDDNAFAIDLYLSADQKEYVRISGNKDLHATYQYIDITRKEGKHDGQWPWNVYYTKDKRKTMVFGASGNPSNPWVVFTKGVLRICGDPRSSRKVCSISLTNGEITDNKDGDGQKHTLTIDYKSERTAPTAGTLNVGTVTENSIALSWTHASDNITPKNKLYYVVEYKTTDESGWAMHYIGNATSYNITGLKPDTEYQVQLRMLDESGNYTRYSKQTVTTKAEAYALKIGGVDVTPANCNDLSEYTGERYTIELAGNNTLESTNGHGLRFIGADLDIRGTGSLTVTSNKRQGFCLAEGKTTLSGGCNVMVAAYQPVSGWKTATLEVNNSTLTAVCTGTDENSITIRSLKSLILTGTTITYPVGAAFDASLMDVALGGELVKTKVVIAPHATGLNTPTSDVPAGKRGIYTLKGVKLNTLFSRLPAGIYIVNGRKIVKK